MTLPAAIATGITTNNIMQSAGPQATANSAAVADDFYHVPVEIKLMIFETCDDVQTAARLAQTNKEFHTIWQKDKESITTKILQPKVHAIDYAVILAKHECSLTSGADVEIGSWIPRLFQNQDEALVVAKLYHAHYHSKKERRRRVDFPLAVPTWRGYYLLRLLVHSHADLDLQKRVSRSIESLSISRLESIRHLALFVTFDQNVGVLDKFQCYKLKNDLRAWLWAEWDVLWWLSREKKYPGSAWDTRCPWTFGVICCDRPCGRRLTDDVEPASSDSSTSEADTDTD